MRTSESIAMWDLYSKTSGVAIQTRKNKITEILDKNEYAYIAKHVDYSNDHEKEFYDNLARRNFEKTLDEKCRGDLCYIDYCFFKKRSCYDHEKEFRFIVSPSPINYLLNSDSVAYEQYNGFHLIIEDYESFIDKIIINPNAPSHFKQTIERLLRKIGMDTLVSKISNSEISSNPNYK